MRDVVNGEGLRGGFTGTMTDHGQRVARADVMRGDLLFCADAQHRSTT